MTETFSPSNKYNTTMDELFVIAYQFGAQKRPVEEVKQLAALSGKALHEEIARFKKDLELKETLDKIRASITEPSSLFTKTTSQSDLRIDTSGLGNVQIQEKSPRKVGSGRQARVPNTPRLKTPQTPVVEKKKTDVGSTRERTEDDTSDPNKKKKQDDFSPFDALAEASCNSPDSKHLDTGMFEEADESETTGEEGDGESGLRQRGRGFKWEDNEIAELVKICNGDDFEEISWEEVAYRMRNANSNFPQTRKTNAYSGKYFKMKQNGKWPQRQ